MIKGEMTVPRPKERPQKVPTKGPLASTAMVVKAPSNGGQGETPIRTPKRIILFVLLSIVSLCSRRQKKNLVLPSIIIIPNKRINIPAPKYFIRLNFGEGINSAKK